MYFVPDSKNILNQLECVDSALALCSPFWKVNLPFTLLLTRPPDACPFSSILIVIVFVINQAAFAAHCSCVTLS